MLEEAKRKEEEKKNELNKYFIDKTTMKPFDPKKKFGMIEDGNQLVYDNLTTAYPLNLPPDQYLEMIKKQMPSANQEFFIRPHHIESIT